ncbi:hypothetical protein HZS_7846, partial [Henneguya salminicola]
MQTQVVMWEVSPPKRHTQPLPSRDAVLQALNFCTEDQIKNKGNFILSLLFKKLKIIMENPFANAKPQVMEIIINTKIDVQTVKKMHVEQIIIVQNVELVGTDII